MTVTTSPRLLLAGAGLLQQAGQTVRLAPFDALLLTWLALEGPTSRARLAALLWPDKDAEAARNSLRQRLFRLRRHADVLSLPAPDTLALAEGVAHDLHESDQVLAATPLALGGELAQWLDAQRERRRVRARDALIDRADAAERERDWVAARQHVMDLLALEPTSEAAHQRLMRVHYLSGDRVAALQAFDRCERVLKDEVGTQPSAGTLALLQAIEQADRVALPAPVQPTPAAVLRPPRLIGRSGAWRTLEEAWAQRRPVLLSGEAGLGKTRMCADFAAARGAVMAGARPGDERVAYASVSRLLRALPSRRLRELSAPVQRELARLLPELGAAPPPLRDAAERTRFFNAVSSALGDRGVVFDDLHFADDASVELLRFAVDAGAGAGCWLLATRPAEGPSAAAVLRQHWSVASEAVHLPLAPLMANEVEELLASLALPGIDPVRDAPPLLRRSGGNPLFLLETLKAGWSPEDGTGRLPAVPGVHALIERRITRLSPGAVQLARCAALAVPDFTIELAAHVLALRTIDLADPWAELEAAQVLVDGAFAHDLIFEAARDSVPPPVARQLHAEIAAFLAARGGEPARLAGHWSCAARWAEAGTAWSAAAERSRQAGRSLDAAAQYAQAAQACAQAGLADQRFAMLLQQAWLLSDDHHGADAQAVVVELQALARDDAQALSALEVRLNLSANRFDSATVVREAPAALRVARRLGLLPAELRLAILNADALADLQRAGEAVALLEPHAEAVRGLADLQLAWDFWSALALARDYADRLHEALPAWNEAAELARRADRQDMLWKTIANQASTLAKMGHVRRAAERNAQACAIIDAIGEQTLRAAQSRTVWAHRLRDTGRFDAALPLFEEVLQAFGAARVETDMAGAEHRLAQLYQQLGQPERAERLLQVERPGLSPRLLTVRLMHRADAAHDLGRDGLPLIRQALALSPDPGDVYHRMASLFATRLVAPDEGEALASSLAAWAGARGRLGLALAAHVRAAACALAQQAPARALPHAEAALHLARDHQPDSFYLPELWLVAGRVEAASGRPERAATLWREGARWVREVAQVPPPFQASFLQRNCVNRDLLALADRTSAGT